MSVRIELDYEAMYRKSAAAEELLRTQVQRLEARAEAAEARCARLKKALAEAINWDGEDELGVPAVWLEEARQALSDTAQQETNDG